MYRILPIVIFDITLVILYFTSIALCRWYDNTFALRSRINALLDTRIDVLLFRMRASMRQRAAVGLLTAGNTTAVRAAVVVYLAYMNIKYRARRTTTKDAKWLTVIPKTAILSAPPRSRG